MEPFPPKAAEEPVTNGSPLSPAARSVWLLDDDASLLKALGRLMKSAGLSAEKFSHPAALLARLKEARCQVVVLDVWMPDINGLEVQTQLRRKSPETQIIFMSGRDEPSVRDAAMSGGALAFLRKPFEDEALVQLVRRALEP
jgi:FixJ family two-component response regulator